MLQGGGEREQGVVVQDPVDLKDEPRQVAGERVGVKNHTTNFVGEGTGVKDHTR